MDDPGGDRGRLKAGRCAVAVTFATAALIDLGYGRQASLAVMMVFAPFVASALLDERDTAVVGVAAVVVAFGLGWPDGAAGTSEQFVRAIAVAAGVVLAVRLTLERQRRQRKLVQVSRVAEMAQQAILYPPPAKLGPIALMTRYLSATAEARVGGDFYDAVITPWGVRLVVGDVRGKGLDAVRLAARLLGEFRSRAPTDVSLGGVVERLDRAAASSGGPEDFATAVLAQFEGDTMTMIRCGHPLPLAIDAGSSLSEVAGPATLPLGLGARCQLAQIDRRAFSGRVLIFSDGAIETRNAEGDEFDLGNSLRRVNALEADAALDAILDDLRRHANGDIDDDVVLVLIEPNTLPRGADHVSDRLSGSAAGGA